MLLRYNFELHEGTERDCEKCGMGAKKRIKR
jgi:hypothetical protein